MLSETATYLDELLEILDDCGFTHRASAPTDATVQGESYLILAVP